MTHKHYFKVLDRNLHDAIQDVNGQPSDLPFGGRSLYLQVTFERYYLLFLKDPVSRNDIMFATMNALYI